MTWDILKQHEEGPAMSPAPANAALIELRGNFVAGHGIRVVLEPGDMTRYDLLIFPSEHGPVVVTRLVGWDPVGTVVIDRDYPVHETEVTPISNHNPWTAKVLAWWLTGFFQTLHAEVPR